MWPMLLSVAELGGSGSISEISDAVIKHYRLAWARSHLKAAGYLINSLRAEAGDALVRIGESDGPRQPHDKWRAVFRTMRRPSTRTAQASPNQEPAALGFEGAPNR